jgi:hypothetical protein
MMEMSKYPKINWELAKPNRKGVTWGHFLKISTANKRHSAPFKSRIIVKLSEVKSTF